DLVADREPLRREGIGQLAVLILQQRDEGRAIGIIFDPLDRGRHAPLTTLEVDEAILLLVAAADAARGDMALVVAPAGLALAFGQSLDRLALVEAGLVHQDQSAPRRACRVIVLECHFSPQIPLVMSIESWPSASVTIAFFTSVRL